MGQTNSSVKEIKFNHLKNGKVFSNGENQIGLALKFYNLIFQKNMNCEFIDKLVSIMEDYPQFVHWSADGSHVILERLKDLENKILPNYFRHHNFASFIRQLNMYGFCKKQKSAKSMTFEHPIFRKGNSSSFHKIVRKSKTRAIKKSEDRFKHINSSLLKKLQSEATLPNTTRQVAIEIFMYHGLISDALRFIKMDTEVLEKELKGARSRSVNRTLEAIKEIVDGPLTKSLGISKALESDISYYAKDEEDKDRQQCSIVNEIVEDGGRKVEEPYEPLSMELDDREMDDFNEFQS